MPSKPAKLFGYFDMKTVRDLLIEIDRDWTNNYITIAVFAEHNGLTTIQAIKVLELARSVSNSTHSDA